MKKIWISLTLLGLAVIALVMVNAGKGVAQGEAGEGDASRAAIGVNIAPLRLNTRGKNAELVGYGSYLVNTAGDCNDCHSTMQFAPGGDPYQGQPKVIDTATYLRGGRAFGPVTSRNLRPEIGTGLPAGLTYAQFVSVMRHGTDFDHPGQLLQVMRWSSYQDMTDNDIRSIYLYLSSLPAVPPGG